MLQSQPSSPIVMLDEPGLATAVAHLCEVDQDLAAVIRQWGLPPLWARPAGFPTLVHIILEQQVSLASAKAAFDRLVVATGELTPQAFLTLDDEALLSIGFSRQKRAYARGVAQALLDGTLDLAALQQLSDHTARTALVSLKGIGPWTADIYLLMALCRADVWPAGDLGLLVAAQEVKNLARRPSPTELIELAEPWRPWRAAAARILWHHYLSK